MREEELICRTGCHWAVFLGPVAVLAVGATMVGHRPADAAVVLAFGLLWGALSGIAYQRTVLGLTSERLRLAVGFPVPVRRDLPLGEIVEIRFYQPALGSLLGFGKVVVRHGKRVHTIRFVSSPAPFVAEVRARMTGPGAGEADASPSSTV